MRPHQTYWVATPRAAGAVTFDGGYYDDNSRLVARETAPYFRKAFGEMTARQAFDHWRKRGYMVERLADTKPPQ